MKTKLTYLILALSSVTIFNCNKPLDKVQPQKFNSPLNAAALKATGRSIVDSLLLNAYTLLDGVYPAEPGNPWQSGTDNWIYGSVAGGEAHKGSTPDDQSEAENIALYTSLPGNSYFEAKWQVNIIGIYYANLVLKQLKLVKDGSVSTAYAAQITAEARFLRGFYELEMAKLWRHVPYIDETVIYNNGYNTVANSSLIWLNIEADFTAAMNHLPNTQAQTGRPNNYAAEAFLVKTLMFYHKYALAKPLLSNLIMSGITSSGAKYALGPYADNFNPSKQNGSEGVFIVQARVHDGSNGYDGNAGDALNFPAGGPATCCGFFQPSFSFVNAFKTDAVTGLPLLDTYNNSDLKSDNGVSSSFPFTPTTATIDSRLDWTVGRRGIPCLDWGIMPGTNWVRDQPDGGPYFNLKTLYYQAAQATTSESFGGWAYNQSTSNCYNAIRFADVLLWAAEVEVEVGSLQKAEDYVNMVRARAAQPSGWVHTYIDPLMPMGGYTNQPAANYKVGLYGVPGGHPGSSFVTGGSGYARKAVYFERTLELGLEGHRFFDLQRWDGKYGGPSPSGFMATTLNAYTAHEATVQYFLPSYSGVHFTSSKNELYPIPQIEITKSNGKLKQNVGY